MTTEFKTTTKIGSNCSGLDGESNRVLTLNNTGLTYDDGLYVAVGYAPLTNGLDFTISHLGASSTITFLNPVFDAQGITVTYQQNTSVAVTSTISYSTPSDVWKHLGKDAYTKVRSESVGTGDGSTSTWSLDHDNVIDGTIALYTSSVAVPTTSYTQNLDDGKISGLTVGSASALTADYDYADIQDSIVKEIISSSDNMIETELGRIFNTTSTTEYLDVNQRQDVFFLKSYPVITLSAVQQNTSSAVSDAPGWSTSVLGLGYDYIANDEDLLHGRLQFINNKPLEGPSRLKIDYIYGYASIPPTIKELSILMSIRTMVNSAIYKSIFKGNDGFTPVRLAEIDLRIEELKRLHKKQSISSI